MQTASRSSSGRFLPLALGPPLVFWAIALKMKQRNASTVLCEVVELVNRTGYTREEVYTAMKAIREKGHKVSWQGREHVHVTIEPDLGLLALFRGLIPSRTSARTSRRLSGI